MFENFLKNHPVIKWTLYVLLTIVCILAIAFATLFGEIIYECILEFGFSIWFLLSTAAPVMCILGAIFTHNKFFNKYMNKQGETKDED